jgi:GNAT superfamily N-acetyltransferase
VRCIMQRMLHFLLDGTLVKIRPIEPEDKHLLVEGLRRLSPEAAFKRFLSPKSRFTDAELKYLTEVDGHDHIAYVAVKDDILVAVGRVVRVDADTADIAILVWDEWQGLGLGSWLARRLADAAAAEGVTKIAGTMLADNRPALRILKHVSTDFVHDDLSHGVREIVTRLAA